MRSAIVLALLLSCTSTSPDRARRTLEAYGFTNIQLTGYDWGACGGGDDTCTGFVALGPDGSTVRGAVGCGYNAGGCGKGCTVRLEP